MKIIAETNYRNETKINIISIIGAIFLSLIFTIIITVERTNLLAFLILALPIVSLLIFNYNFIYLFLIIGIFLNIQYSYFSHVVLYTLLIPISFSLNFKDVKISDFSIPLSKYFFIYLLAIFLSIINSVKPISSLILTYNYIAFLITIFFSVAFIKHTNQIKRYMNLYVFLVAMNSLHVIIESILLQKRSFGFAGIMYVDYVGIGIIIVMASILTNKKNILIKISLIILFMIGSIMAQTRNPWITILFTISLMLVITYRHSIKTTIDKKRIKRIIIFAIILVPIVIGSVYFFNPQSFERVNHKNVEVSIDEDGNTNNSFITRIFIWHTALNAVVEHPIIGIGAYSFPFSSQYYYSIPKILYNMYVKGLSPHVGYLEVLTENGIVGLIAFVIMIMAIIKYIIKMLSGIDKDVSEIALMINWPLIYISISLIMTDAWLWGKGIILWGFFLGLSFSFYKIKMNEIV